MDEKEIISRIQQKLTEIEEKGDIKILHCVESGSRSWGFASPDSDFDVRFIYIRKPEFYLKLGKTRDVIEWELNDIYDINGWDIQKALRLLHNSNPTVFEWNHSPIVYRTSENWEKVREIINDYFLSRTGMNHYLSTARHNYKEYIKGDEVKLKKYFYVLRPILACRWIMDRGTPPPMLFSELMNAELDENLFDPVNKLLEIKMRTSELGTGKRIDVINEYIEKQFEILKEKLDSMEREEQKSWEKLDELFLSLLKNA
ncbi:MAG: nucleotidyltransferase domain-containing protein [Ruminococcus sp.]|nr:nucleotidyltransferase domain-containing protein [Ruminococcus sp.]